VLNFSQNSGKIHEGKLRHPPSREDRGQRRRRTITVTWEASKNVGDSRPRNLTSGSGSSRRDGEFFLLEVTSSNDKLSEDQKRWIKGNAAELGLPFKVVKIHRKSVVELSEATNAE
jgi:hypothetical protein